MKPADEPLLIESSDSFQQIHHIGCTIDEFDHKYLQHSIFWPILQEFGQFTHLVEIVLLPHLGIWAAKLIAYQGHCAQIVAQHLSRLRQIAGDDCAHRFIRHQFGEFQESKRSTEEWVRPCPRLRHPQSSRRSLRIVSAEPQWWVSTIQLPIRCALERILLVINKIKWKLSTHLALVVHQLKIRCFRSNQTEMGTAQSNWEIRTGAQSDRHVRLHHFREYRRTGYWMRAIRYQRTSEEAKVTKCKREKTWHDAIDAFPYGRRNSGTHLSMQSRRKQILPNLITTIFIIRWQARPKAVPDLCSPMDGSEITSFNIAKKTLNAAFSLQSPDENHFAITPENRSPSNVFRSEDCNELLAKELAKLDETTTMVDDQSPDDRFNLVSQSSIEIEFSNEKDNDPTSQANIEPELLGEVSLSARMNTIGRIWRVYLALPLFISNRNGQFWTFTLAYLCLMSIAIHAFVNTLSKDSVTMKCKRLQTCAQAHPFNRPHSFYFWISDWKNCHKSMPKWTRHSWNSSHNAW